MVNVSSAISLLIAGGLLTISNHSQLTLCVTEIGVVDMCRWTTASSGITAP